MAETLASAAGSLTDRQRRLLELMRLQRLQAGPDAEAPAIPSRPPGAEPVLSFGQKRLWFIEQLQPGSAAYHVPGAVRIRGALDVAVLQRCLIEVARRHEILRTGFVVRDGEPALAVDPEPRPRLPVTDLSALPDGRREGEAVRVVNAQVVQPFDLTSPPLARTSLVRLAGGETIFLLILQHIISDIWSVGVFFRNAMALYDAFSAGLPSSLPALPVQYADYATLQQERLQGDSLRALLDYWRRQVEGAPLVIELPADHPRPPLQSFAGGRRYMAFPVDLTERLKEIAKEQNASLHMLLLAALDILLHRLTGQRSILVGVPMANRSRLELEGLIGLLFNALALRRALRRELGASPVELAQTHRLQLARRLLADTALPVIDVAYASGFESLRRFNAAFRERYGTSPGQARKSQPAAPSEAARWRSLTPPSAGRRRAGSGPRIRQAAASSPGSLDNRADPRESA